MQNDQNQISNLADDAGAVVVLGTGLAGYAVAREFRKLDKSTPLVLVSRDHAGFYSKPQLSNAIAGNKTAETLVMKSADKMAAELAATILANAEVAAIDPAARAVRLADGKTLRYRDLVIAAGADPVRVDFKGDAGEAILSVNDLDDYGRFARRLEGVKTVAILGAGLIGCEFANDLAHRGIGAVLVDPAPHALSRLLPPAAAAHLERRLSAVGIQFRLGTGARNVRHQDAGFLIELDDGGTVAADLVLSAIGLRPRTQLARDAGLAIGRGIRVDRHLATSAPHVHAVGDCAEVDGETSPYVLPLMQQSRALAATLAGTHTRVVYPAMPVTLKTPACPTVVCPPASQAAGTWTVDVDGDDLEGRFTGPDGQLLGFVLMGGATARRQALMAQVPPRWIDA